MNAKILKMLAKNAKLTYHDIASQLGLSDGEVEHEVREMEKNGLIRGYRTVVDWDQLDSALVSAIIELKVTPSTGHGFEEIAEKVMKYPEVESVYLMSGTYDLNVIVKAKTFQQVAMFVARELAPMEAVTSTSTHFVLRRYKDMDVQLVNGDSDDRGSYLL